MSHLVAPAGACVTDEVLRRFETGLEVHVYSTLIKQKRCDVQKVKALFKRAEEKFPLLKGVCGKDGTAVVKKKVMMLFVNAAKSENIDPVCNLLNGRAVAHVLRCLHKTDRTGRCMH